MATVTGEPFMNLPHPARMDGNVDGWMENKWMDGDALEHDCACECVTRPVHVKLGHSLITTKPFCRWELKPAILRLTIN